MNSIRIPALVCVASMAMLAACSSTADIDTGTGVGGGSSSSKSSGSTTSSGANGTGGTVGNPVNECLDGSHACDVNAICIDQADGYTCQCVDGYEGDGKTCTDIDECATMTAECSENATCTNSQGTFSCACNPGYNGQGKTCVDTDSCPNPTVVDPDSLPVEIFGSTIDETPDSRVGDSACAGVTSAAGAASNDAAYSFTPTFTDNYSITLKSADFNALLYVATDCAELNTNSCLAAVDTSCAANCVETLSMRLTAGQEYFIVVDGSSDTSNQAGHYSLLVSRVVRPIDVSSVLTDDTVLNRGMAGALDTTQSAMDRTNHVLATKSAADLVSGGTARGLPDDAFFAANSYHSDIKLNWNNESDGPNSRILQNDGAVITFPVNVAGCDGLQVFGTATEGQSNVTFTLRYRDGTSVPQTILFKDWFRGSVSSVDQFLLIEDLSRGQSDGTSMEASELVIMGANLIVDSTKTLQSVSVQVLGGGAGAEGSWFVFYGAVATGTATP